MNRIKTKILVGVGITVFVLYSYMGIQKIMNTWYLPFSYERKAIITQITHFYPRINKNTVFYVTCKEATICTPDNTILPFQSGAGHTLLVNYAVQNEREYAPFFAGFFLWDPDSQGYMRINNIGYGYFRDIGKLKKLIRSGEISSNDVISFSYDMQKNKIENITPKIRAELATVSASLEE